MTRFHFLLLGLLVSTLTACVAPPVKPEAPAPLPPVAALPIDISAVSDVQAEIKRQVGLYLAAIKPRGPAGPMVVVDGVLMPVSKLDFACGSGRINFDIASIQAELATTLDAARPVKFAVTVPAGAAASIQGAGVAHEPGNQQSFDYTLWPLPASEQDPALTERMPSDAEILAAPIARVLLDLRNALILGASTGSYSTAEQKKATPVQPCFSDYNPDAPAADPGNVFRIGLSVHYDPSSGVSIGLAPVVGNSAGEHRSSTGNALTVSFIQRDLSGIQSLKAAVDGECRFPEEHGPVCILAHLALRSVTAPKALRDAELDDFYEGLSRLCEAPAKAAAPPVKPAGKGKGKAPEPRPEVHGEAHQSDCRKAKALQELLADIHREAAGVGIFAERVQILKSRAWAH